MLWPFVFHWWAAINCSRSQGLRVTPWKCFVVETGLTCACFKSRDFKTQCSARVRVLFPMVSFFSPQAIISPRKLRGAKTTWELDLSSEEDYIPHAEKRFYFYLFLDLKPCNHTTSINKGGSIYLNDHEKIKDWNSRCCCPLLHVVGFCSTDCCPCSRLQPCSQLLPLQQAAIPIVLMAYHAPMGCCSYALAKPMGCAGCDLPRL